MNSLIKLFKKIVNSYELKHPVYVEPIYICPNIDTRNRYKLDEWKRDKDQPQCPVYQDNRCCGGCIYATECHHCVDCNCYGFRYAAMGGTDNIYLRKASIYSIGRLDKEGEFDWNYYKRQSNLKKIIPNKFIIIENRIYKIKSSTNKRGNFSAISCTSNKLRKFNIDKLSDRIEVYDDQERAEFWNKIKLETAD